MTSVFDESNESIQDLPVALQEVLRRYAETRSDGDLNEVIIAALSDLGEPSGPDGTLTVPTTGGDAAASTMTVVERFTACPVSSCTVTWTVYTPLPA